MADYSEAEIAELQKDVEYAAIEYYKLRRQLREVEAEASEWRRLMRIYRDAYTDMVDPDVREATRTMCRRALFVFLDNLTPAGVVERPDRDVPTPAGPTRPTPDPT